MFQNDVRGYVFINSSSKKKIQQQKMKRGSIRKASTFKLQLARQKFEGYLEKIQNCPVSRRFPDMHEMIKESSQKTYEMVYNNFEDSPFLMGLNYDDKFIGFTIIDKMVTYRQFLPNVKEAYLMGEFNSFDKNQHKLERQDQKSSWFTVEINTNKWKMVEGQKVMLRVVDKVDCQWHVAPPCCNILNSGYGIMMRSTSGLPAIKSKTYNLLSYTIDLEEIHLDQILKFIDAEGKNLEQFNTIILKNLFSSKKALNKFSLTTKEIQQLNEIISKLQEEMGIKVVFEWNFQELKLSAKELNPIEKYFMRESNGGFMFDISKKEVIGYYLSKISFYMKFFGIGGIHFTKVHHLTHQVNGITLIKAINLMCERLNSESITLASSKEKVPGLAESLLQGGLGFNYIYNYNDSLDLKGTCHMKLSNLIQQIHTNSNCLALDFKNISNQHFNHILFSILVSKKGIFTRGPLQGVSQFLTKILSLRKQEELFPIDLTEEMMNEKGAIFRRGNTRILLNFSQQDLLVEVKEEEMGAVVFNEKQQSTKPQGGILKLAPYNCVIFDEDEQE